MCDNKTIKELLPEYHVLRSADPEKERVEKHLESCGDCRRELAVLGMMREEPVPDPGEAYWAAMSDRVYWAVQAQNTNKHSFDLSWFADRFTIPRWAIAAAFACMVAMVSWFAVHPLGKGPEAPASKGFEIADELVATDGPRLSSLDPDQFETVASWAGKELSSIGSEAALVAANGTDVADIDEELSGLSSRDAERLSKILDQYVEEV